MDCLDHEESSKMRENKLAKNRECRGSRDFKLARKDGLGIHRVQQKSPGSRYRLVETIKTFGFSAKQGGYQSSPQGIQLLLTKQIPLQKTVIHYLFNLLQFIPFAQ